MEDKVNLAAKIALLDDPYQPGIVGRINDHKLQVVKVEGHVLLIEPDGTPNTGDAGGEMTAEPREI